MGVVEKWRRLRALDGDRDGYADEVEGVVGFSGILSWVQSVWKIPYVLATPHTPVSISS